MKRFLYRHKRLWLIWAVLAAISLVTCAALWLIFVPRGPLLHWSWLTVKLMLSWGAPVLAWMTGKEAKWWLARSESRAFRG